jgi:hypothetical protein
VVEVVDQLNFLEVLEINLVLMEVQVVEEDHTIIQEMEDVVVQVIRLPYLLLKVMMVEIQLEIKVMLVAAVAVLVLLDQHLQTHLTEMVEQVEQVLHLL